MAYLAAQRANPAEQLFPDVRALPRWRCRRSRRSSTTTSRPSSAASASCRGTGSPSARSSRCRRSTIPTSSSRTPRARTTPGRRGQGRASSTARSRVRARRARSGSRGRSSSAATSTRRSTRTAFDDDGYFRTGDLGVPRRRRLHRDHRAAQGRHHPQGREHQRQGGRRPALHAPQGRRRRRDRPARPRSRGSGAVRVVVPADADEPADARRAVRVPAGRAGSWCRRSPSSSRSST